MNSEKVKEIKKALEQNDGNGIMYEVNGQKCTCKFIHHKDVLTLVNELESENQQLKDRITELEDRIENGTLMALPCKVGDFLYCVFNSSSLFPPQEEHRWVMRKYQVTKIWFDFNGLSMDLYCYGIVHKDDIGKTVFFTEAEAKAKLKELEEKV